MMDSAAVMREQVREAAVRLQESWAWLGLLVEPGRETCGPGRVATDAERELQWYRAMHERAYKLAALRAGRGALVATPAGARVGVIDAQVQVHAGVVAAMRRLAAGLHATYVGPAAGVDPVLAALDWLLAIEEEVGAELLAAVDGDLRRADRVARDAARVGGDLETGQPGVVRQLYAPIDGRCPACGHKSLQLVHDGDEGGKRSWHVRCVSEACRCAGQGCACRQRVRYAGRRHAWAYGELTGPYGLWRAMAAASPSRPRFGSTTAGHGGWADRRMEA